MKDLNSPLSQLIARIEPKSVEHAAQARAHIEKLTMPHWAMGRILDLATDLSAITRSLSPPVSRKAIFVMAGDHGITEEGVSLYPKEVTAQMIANFIAGGAAINVLSRQANARTIVVDIGVDADLSVHRQDYSETTFSEAPLPGNRNNSSSSCLINLGLKSEVQVCRDGVLNPAPFPHGSHPALKGEVSLCSMIHAKIRWGTHNFAKTLAMSREEAEQAVLIGFKLAEKYAAEIDVFGTGDMGIGNTTSSAAITSALTGIPVEKIVGRGTGIDDPTLLHKISVVEKALTLHHPNPHDALDVLSKVGGFEIAGIAGLILGAAAMKRPILVDGYISTAGALLAHSICPHAMDYVIASHSSAENGHILMWQHLKKKPLLDLGLRLGEGTGAALAMHLVEASARILTEMATFESAKVSQKPAET